MLENVYEGINASHVYIQSVFVALLFVLFLFIFCVIFVRLFLGSQRRSRGLGFPAG